MKALMSGEGTIAN